jgi:hypothetical protein
MSQTFKTPPPRSGTLRAMPDIDKAREFMELHARVLDRRRFEHHFGGASADPVVDALRAYANEDGGFGHGLEPDLRDPASQPGAVETALRVLDWAGRFGDPLVTGALDWLERNEAPGGGITFALPSVAGHPSAPWWQADPEGAASLTLTGMIAGTLARNGVEHPWLDRASEWLWREAESREELAAYEALGICAFLNHAPDRDRAGRAVERLRGALLAVVELDPHAGGESHGPLEFAPRPGSVVRRLFDDATIEAHLDALESGQRPDGGWVFDWPSWAPLAELEWRGALTVEWPLVLEVNGRL